MKPFSLEMTGKVTVAAGITSVMATIALLGFFGGTGFLGGIGDLMDVLNSALVVPLFITLGGITMANCKAVGRSAQVSSAVGALMRMAGAFLIFSGLMVYEEAVLLVNAGAGLMGVAILLFVGLNRRRQDLKTGYVVFATAVGGVMVLSLPGLLLQDQFTPLLRGEVGFADANPFVVALLLLSPIFILGYPIWLLWTGRLLLKAPENEPFLIELS